MKFVITMEKERNYYHLLGLDSDADSDEIRHAYRTAARKHHPDTSHGDSERFRHIREAYEVLSDTERRVEYDKGHASGSLRVEVSPQSGESGRRGQSGSVGEAVYRDFAYPYRRRSVMESFMGDFFSGVFGGFAAREEGPSLEIILTPGEARTGGRVPVEVSLQAICPRCLGLGCGACSGTGGIEIPSEIAIDYPPGIASGAEKVVLLRHGGVTTSRLRVTFWVSG